VYRGPAAGAPAPDYLNIVVAAETALSVDALHAALREIEALAGRTRGHPAVCELDLDLLLYGARVAAERRLPRPDAFTLPFVVLPLADVAPRLVHPVTGERCAVAARAHGDGALLDLGAAISPP
jgi:2-amino-4-hydroxy-6-hydroxymethyldihydropteridine diphosphokinase